MTASKVETPALTLERREGVKRWCVVHEESGIAALWGLRSRKAAEAVRERLLELPIRWEIETHSSPQVGTPGAPHVYLPARTYRRLVDADSRSLLLAEQAAILGARGQ